MATTRRELLGAGASAALGLFPWAIPRLYLPRLHQRVELQNYKRGTMAISLTSCLQAVTTGS